MHKRVCAGYEGGVSEGMSWGGTWMRMDGVRQGGQTQDKHMVVWSMNRHTTV